MNIDARTSVMNGQVWEKFCGQLAGAGKQILREDMPGTPGDRIAGWRYLIGILASSIDLWMWAANPDHPEFVNVYGPHQGWSLANPDAVYHRARVRGDRRYRVWGKRGVIPYISFQLSKGIWSYRKPAITLSSMSNKDLQVEADGSYEIILSEARPDPTPKNWIQLQPSVEWLHIRRFYNDWDEDPGEFFIECLDEETGPLAPNEEDIVTRINEVAWFVGDTAQLWADYVLHMRKLLGPNVFSTPTPPGGSLDAPLVKDAGATENMYSQGFYILEQDEAMIIEFTPPPAQYWNIQVGNFWYEAPDFANIISSYNGKQAHIGTDGVFRAVLAHRDPGLINWLDAGGHREGAMLVRYQFPEGTTEQPRTRVVRLADVASQLPPDTPRVTQQQRRAQLARRREAVRRRFC